MSNNFREKIDNFADRKEGQKHNGTEAMRVKIMTIMEIQVMYLQVISVSES